MKSKLSKLLSVLLACIMCFSLAACGTANGGEEEQIDETRTQLYVFNFYGGYGSDWISSVKKRYEELHKDDVYEEGKKGVQIYVNNQKSAASEIANQILTNRDEVYFTEYAFYYTLKSLGVLGDITPAVTEDIGYGDAAGKTIESKLTDEQKSYYGIEESGTPHYYAIPHYSGYSGLIYNVDLFNERGYYFIDNPGEVESIDEYFVRPGSSDKKSKGPDGIEKTYDDGLPATYEEFLLLCRYIAEGGDTPIIWSGKNYKDYINNFMQSLVADYEGLDQMMLNYTTNGVATDLGTATSSGFVKDAQTTTINESNGYELSRQAGKYYALDFIETLVKTDSYHNKDGFNSSLTHMNAQENFLYAGHDGETKPIAMLCDGIWWQSEASPTFKEMVDAKDESYSKQNRNFAFMPLPKANADKIGKTTLFDHMYSVCFMKANIADWKKDLAYDFIKFCNSDESLVEFTQITDTPKALNYTMTEEQMNKMSPYGKSVITLKQNSDIVYPYASTSLYKNNQSQFWTHNLYYSHFSGGENQWCAEAFHEKNVSAEDYFNGLKTYYVAQWSKLNR